MSFTSPILGASTTVAAAHFATTNCKSRSLQQIFSRSVGDMAIASAATTLNFITPSLAAHAVVVACLSKAAAHFVLNDTFHDLLITIETLAKNTFTLYTFFCITTPVVAGSISLLYLGIIASLSASRNTTPASIPVTPQKIDPPKDLLKFMKEHLQKAYQENYNKPFLKSPGETTKATYNGIQYTVHRPNHGLTHAAKQSCLIRNLTEMLGTYDKGPFGTWIRNKISNDSIFMEKLALAGIYMRAARVDESSGDHNLLSNSKKLYEEKATATGFSTSEIKAFAHAHLVDPDPKKGSLACNEKLLLQEEDDKKYIAALLNIGHLSDHRRIHRWSTRLSFEQQTNFLTGCGISKNEAKIYVEALWDRSGRLQDIVGCAKAESRPGKNDSMPPSGGLITTAGHNVGTVNPACFLRLESNPEELARKVNRIASQPIMLS